MESKSISASTPAIRSWKDFAKRVRRNGCGLLRRLPDFRNAVLVTGCQRSGTTMLSRRITHSEGMAKYQFTEDEELDAAQILSGTVTLYPKGRYCFQTTYVNECYDEYFREGTDFRMIWVVRNPYSVVYSMLYRWRRFALNELFTSCGGHLLEPAKRKRYERFGRLGVRPLTRACLAYQGKVSQLFDIRKRLDGDRLMVVDYDKLIVDKDRLLKRIYEFIELPYRAEYSGYIREGSTLRAERLAAWEAETIRGYCSEVYGEALKCAAS